MLRFFMIMGNSNFNFFHFVYLLVYFREVGIVPGPEIFTACDTGYFSECRLVYFHRYLLVMSNTKLVLKWIRRRAIGTQAHGINPHPKLLSDLGGSYWRD